MDNLFIFPINDDNFNNFMNNLKSFPLNIEYLANFSFNKYM